MKTSETYKEEVFEKYIREKGGIMKTYLTKPTRKQIRVACLWLLDKRNSRNDGYILDRFFQFEDGKSKSLGIQKIDADKFLPVVNFLKGKSKSTSIENLELISWLVDFQPRPLQEYLKNDNCIAVEENVLNKSKIEIKEVEEIAENIVHNNYKDHKGEKKREDGGSWKPKWPIVIGVVFGAVLLGLFYLGDFLDGATVYSKEARCMTWAKNHYEEISCETKPYSKYGTDVVPYEEVKIKNFKKIEVNMATEFFSQVTHKPLIWYVKNKDGEIEYFTSPGLHPLTGKTLDEITPYIIQKYVPLHSNNKDSFVD